MGTIDTDILLPPKDEKPSGEPTKTFYDRAYEDFAALGEVPVKTAAEITDMELADHVKGILAKRILEELNSDPKKYDTADPDACAVALETASMKRLTNDVYKVVAVNKSTVDVSLDDDSAIGKLSDLVGRAAVFSNGMILTVRESRGAASVGFAYGGRGQDIAPPVNPGDTFTIHDHEEVVTPARKILLGVPYAPNVITAADVTEALKG
jgi:hypothetical protein